MGVWIEKSRPPSCRRPLWSLPVWECGLKMFISGAIAFHEMSLPVWECGLKTPPPVQRVEYAQSLPVWECGLKIFIILILFFLLLSLPVWECGLKSPKAMPHIKPYIVTPCMGVWIENLDKHSIAKSLRVTPCMGVWIENRRA